MRKFDRSGFFDVFIETKKVNGVWFACFPEFSKPMPFATGKTRKESLVNLSRKINKLESVETIHWIPYMKRQDKEQFLRKIRRHEYYVG